MSQNKNALIRYKTLDKCLQNQYRKWTLNDLIEACSDALYEYEGRDINVSKRTIQLDIQLMRSDKLGYNAPIVVYDRKYYKYEEPNFSITNIPITENDMQVLTETVEMLKQFKDFSLFSELGGIIHRLEDTIYTEKNKTSPIIHLDKNENLKGLKHLEFLYQTIVKEIVIKIHYQSFKSRNPGVFIIHPYILKEFNNRWFIVGRKEGQEKIINLALDRILDLEYDLDIPYKKENFNSNDYYKKTIGVTVLNDKSLYDIVLKFNRLNAPYVITKPLHHSQEILETLNDGVIFKIRVHLNFELERVILGFGNAVEVLSPRILRSRIARNLAIANAKYQKVNK